MERSRALRQAFGLAWPWFAGALACLALCVLLSVTTSEPAKVINVLPCAYWVSKYSSVPGSQALVQTADGRDHYTLCQEGQPFTIGRETQLDQSIFGGDPINPLYPTVALLLTGFLAFCGAQVLRQQRSIHARQQQRAARHKRRHKGGAGRRVSGLSDEA